MFASSRLIAVAVAASLLLALDAMAQIGGTGWKSATVKFNVQWPTNAAENTRYFVTNAPLPTYHCLTYSTDGAFSVGNTTKPRTEQRFEPDYTNGEIQYQANLMAVSNENSYCVFQIHTGDAQSPTYGSTTFMLFWFTNDNGSVHDYSGTELASNLGNKWFQLNVDHDIATGEILVWVNQKQVWSQQDNGAGDFYMKDGVYEQDHNPTLQMDTYITNILMWVSSGTNPPAAPTGLVATNSTKQIGLTWNASVNATNYDVKRSTVNGGPYTIITNLTGTSYADTNVMVGTTYFYVVSAVDGFGQSSNSLPVSSALINNGFQLSAGPATQTIYAGISTSYTVTMITNTAFAGSVTLGVSGLATGITANFFPPTLSASGTSTLTINTTTNTPAKTYALGIGGTNGSVIFSTSVNLNVLAVSVGPGLLQWTGTSGTDTNWSTALNWTNVTSGGFGPPGTNNSVIFTNAGTVPIPGTINNVVDSSVSVLSVQYSQTNNYHTTLIAPGQTLLIGTNLTAGTGTDLGAAGTLNAAITGSGGTLSITNTNCVVIVRQGTAAGSAPWMQCATLDLSGLGYFNGSLSRLLVAADGGSSAFNSREVGVLYLARTNTISAAGAAPAIVVADNPSNGAGTSGDPSQLTSDLYLGMTNGIFADAITIGRGKSAGVMSFNPAFLTGLTPTVYLRGLTAARVGTFSIGDESGLGSSNQRGAGTVDWSGGAVDAQIGTTYVGRSMNGSNLGTAASATGTLTFDAGMIGVNTLEIGYQTFATDTGPGPVGAVNVNGTGVLSVGQTLELAHGTTTAPLEQGILNINGGTVEVTNIIGGGGLSTININSGTLDLRAGNPFPGRIANVSSLAIGNSAVDDPALLANAASIMASNGIVIAENGTLAGNTVITSPGLTVNGVIAPGIDAAGGMTNNGPVNFSTDGNYVVTVQDATADPVAGWSFLKVTGGLGFQATLADPFTIQPQSIGAAANFNYTNHYDWIIATANAGVTGYGPATVIVDDSLFVNDLAGGYFYLSTPGNSLVLSFTNNHPPVAQPVTLFRTANIMTIPLASVAVHWSDPDGDPVVLAGINGSSSGGINNVSTDGTNIYYTNSTSAVDVITYTVQDVRTNPPAIYRPGDTIQTGTGVVNIISELPMLNHPGLQASGLVLSGNQGVPLGTYYVLATTNLSLPMAAWNVIATNTFDAGGNFNCTNGINVLAPQTFYELKLQ